MLTLDPDSNRQFIIIRNHQDIAVCTTELNEHDQLISQTTAEFDSQNRIRGFFCYTACCRARKISLLCCDKLLLILLHPVQRCFKSCRTWAGFFMLGRNQHFHCSALW